MPGKVAKELGMTLLYHNHDFEFEKINGKYALDILYKEVPADLLETEMDTCWGNVDGEYPPPYIRKYRGRAPVVHLKELSLSWATARIMRLLIASVIGSVFTCEVA